jgi:DNA-binding transcriptional MerR regulator
MEKHAKAYPIHELAEMAGVSVRTLHHYDQINLLKPTARNAAGYRLYQEKELLRLQQILFFKELGLPLRQIRSILDQPGFDQVSALKDHRRLLQTEMERLALLLHTIDRTIIKIMEDPMELTDAELYEGFPQETAERYQREAAALWPEKYAEANRRIRKLSKEQWNAIKAEGDALTRQLAGLMDKAPGDAQVQQAIARHQAWIENFYAAPADLYRGLGQMYAEHPEFRANYERYAPGLADFVRAGIEYYCEHTLSKV